MILSTLELQPTFNVTGTQLTSNAPLMSIPQLDGSFEEYPRRPTMISSNLDLPRVSFAVPATDPSRGGSSKTSNAAYLQTVDPRSGDQISRQALVRTKVTDVNMGPEGNVIDEPNVVLLRTSQDGRWLASVEEWYPPHLEIGGWNSSLPEEPGRSQRLAMETSLKIWSWSHVAKDWELSFRFDRPHSNSSTGDPGIILDLIELSSSPGFITVGDDDLIRCWRRKSRIRNGQEVKNLRNELLSTWSCKQIIHLPKYDDSLQKFSRLTSSRDDSLLISAHQTESKSVVHIIDLARGNIRSSRTDLISGSLFDVGVVKLSLVILSNQLIVWDLVNDHRTYSIDLHLQSLSTFRLPAVHLAVDQNTNTFAVAVPDKDHGRKVRSRFLIFDTTSPEPISQTELPHLIRGLLSTQQKTFYVIDHAAVIHTISPMLSVPTIPENVIQEESSSALKTTTSNVPPTSLTLALSRRPAASTMEDDQTSTLLQIENTRPEEEGNVIRQSDLTGLFGLAQPLAMPSMAKIFETVVSVVAGKGNSVKAG